MHKATQISLMSRRLILAWSLAFVPKGWADLIPDGYHGVNHEIFFTGMDYFPEWDFGLFPAAASVSWKVLKVGEEPYWYKFVDPRVYAWLKSKGPPENAAFFQNPALPRTAETFQRIGVVKVDDPLWRIRTTYRITGIEGSLVTCRVESEWLFDRDSRLLGPVRDGLPPAPPTEPTRWGRTAGFGLLAVISGALLVRLIRNLQRSHAAASTLGPPIP